MLVDLSISRYSSFFFFFSESLIARLLSRRGKQSVVVISRIHTHKKCQTSKSIPQLSGQRLARHNVVSLGPLVSRRHFLIALTTSPRFFFFLFIIFVYRYSLGVSSDRVHEFPLQRSFYEVPGCISRRSFSPAVCALNAAVTRSLFLFLRLRERASSHVSRQRRWHCKLRVRRLLGRNRR